MTEYFNQCCIIIFQPQLINPDENDLRIAATLVQHIHDITNELPVSKHIYYNQSIELNDQWENESCSKFLKEGNDPGEQMENAFENAFDAGFRKVILVRSLLTSITSKHLQEALLSLKIIEFCIGPDKKGGYYLIGMNRFEPVVLKNKDFNSDTLLKSTIREIGSLKDALYKLSTLE